MVSILRRLHGVGRMPEEHHFDDSEKSSDWTEITFHVRYAETDQMGVVHHSHYIVWAEEGRSALLRSLGSSYTEFEAGDHYLAVSQIHARYLSPARFDRAIIVRTRVVEMRSRTITFDYEIVDAQAAQLLATVQTCHVCVDRNGNVTTIPPAWRQRLMTAMTTKAKQRVDY
jgi:acyl-CoA thioester hydrolase